MTATTPAHPTDSSATAGIQAKFKLLRHHAQRGYFRSKPKNQSPSFQLEVDLQLPGKGVTALFGQSGSGKTTLLRCIAGLDQAPDGELWVNGECWQQGQHFLPTHKRPLGYVFQEAGLFPHLNAEQNIEFALKRCPRRPSPQRYQQVIELMAIGPVLTRHPHQLSGGERQRVAIARALLMEPELLLMDEPLASLDAQRKNEILPFLERLRQETRTPIIYVSHSADEVTRLADSIVVMQQGKTLAFGALNEVLANLDLPLKLGEDTGVVVTGQVVERQPEWQLIRVAFNGGSLWVRDDGDDLHSSVRIRILARDISLANAPHRDTSIVNLFHGTLLASKQDAHPAMVISEVQIGDCLMLARTTRRSLSHLGLKPGDKVWLQIKSVAVVR